MEPYLTDLDYLEPYSSGPSPILLIVGIFLFVFALIGLVLWLMRRSDKRVEKDMKREQSAREEETCRRREAIIDRLTKDGFIDPDPVFSWHGWLNDISIENPVNGSRLPIDLRDDGRVRLVKPGTKLVYFVSSGDELEAVLRRDT